MIGPLSWILIYVSDIDKTRHFYEKVLELPLKSVRPQIVVFRTGACTLELMAKLDNGPQPSEMDDVRGWRRNKVRSPFTSKISKPRSRRSKSAAANVFQELSQRSALPGSLLKAELLNLLIPRAISSSYARNRWTDPRIAALS